MQLSAKATSSQVSMIAPLLGSPMNDGKALAFMRVIGASATFPFQFNATILITMDHKNPLVANENEILPSSEGVTSPSGRVAGSMTYASDFRLPASPVSVAQSTTFPTTRTAAV